MPCKTCSKQVCFDCDTNIIIAENPSCPFCRSGLPQWTDIVAQASPCQLDSYIKQHFALEKEDWKDIDRCCQVIVKLMTTYGSITQVDDLMLHVDADTMYNAILQLGSEIEKDLISCGKSSLLELYRHIIDHWAIEFDLIVHYFFTATTSPLLREVPVFRRCFQFFGLDEDGEEDDITVIMKPFVPQINFVPLSAEVYMRKRE